MDPDTPTALSEDYNTDQRRDMAKRGDALPDGSFPIRTVQDLRHAIHLWSQATNPAEAKAHIIKRAKALGAENELPMGWTTRTHESDARTHGPTVHIHESDVLEAEFREAEDGRHLVEVTLIRAGTSKNGNTYSHQLLRESVPLFEGARAFADHSRADGLPERSVRDLVGYYTAVRYEESGRLRAQLHLVPGNDWLWNLIKESSHNPRLCGLSIDASGSVEAEGGVRRVTALREVASIDIVTRPAAGGSFDRLVASDRPEPAVPPVAAPLTSPPSPKENTVNDPAPPTTVTESTQQPTMPTPNQPQNPAPDLAQLVEQMKRDNDALRSQLQSVTSVLAPASATPVDHTAQLTQLAEEIKRERDLARCETALAGKLAEAALPEPVAHKIRKQFAGRIFEATTLEAAIAEEKDTLAALTSQGLITGMGHEKPITFGLSEYEQVQAAFDALFDIYESDSARSVPRFSGIREAFTVATGVDVGNIGGVDRQILPHLAEGLRARVRAGNLRESDVILREADVTTATFSYLLGTSMNKRLMMDYQAWPSEWQKFTNVVAIKDFKTQDRIRLGAFGSLSTVAEDNAYTTLSLADTHATYAATKRGNLVQVTRETIINDDLYAIKQIPQKLAVAAAFTLAEFVYNLLAPNYGNIYDAHPLFDSVNHLNTNVVAGNLGTKNSGSALSSGAMQTAVVSMRKQQNSAGKPIGLKPRYLVVVPDLEFTAMTVLKSAGLPGGNNNDINPMMGYCEPIVSPQLSNTAAGPANTTTLWVAIADPKVVDTIEIGFIGGQANPVLLIQDMPLYGLNFTQDVISYKVRHEYGGAIVDYRGFYLGNN